MRAATIAAPIVALALLGGQSRAQEPADAGYSAAGLYNVANSYARAGKPGMAVLNYERAALLAPNDADIQANLNYVRSSLHLAPQASSRVSQVVRLASPSSVAWIGVLGVIVLGASLLSTKFSRRLRALRFAGIVLGIAALSFTSCNALVQWPKIREAVVIVEQTPIRVSPVPMGDALLQLTEAESVTVIAEHEDFVLVRTATGRSGWAARADVADVVPRHTEQFSR
jgi:tetratricopeptide (TPR) repeat protein